MWKSGDDFLVAYYDSRIPEEQTGEITAFDRRGNLYTFGLYEVPPISTLVFSVCEHRGVHQSVSQAHSSPPTLSESLFDEISPAVTTDGWFASIQSDSGGGGGGGGGIMDYWTLQYVDIVDVSEPPIAMPPEIYAKTNGGTIMIIIIGRNISSGFRLLLTCSIHFTSGLITSIKSLRIAFVNGLMCLINWF